MNQRWDWLWPLVWQAFDGDEEARKIVTVCSWSWGSGLVPDFGPAPTQGTDD